MNKQQNGLKDIFTLIFWLMVALGGVIVMTILNVISVLSRFIMKITSKS